MVVVAFGSKKNKYSMKAHWRKILSFLPEKTQRKYYHNFFQKEHQEWILKGKPLPVSNLAKQEALRFFKEKYKLNILVETGTYLGDTLYALANDFEQLYSIELSQHYYDLAKKRFKNFKQINLLYGDSGKVLNELVPTLKGPALFWLDGHYSGGLTAKGDLECPVYDELNAIFASPHKHVIFIDDARLFIGKNDYPTVENLTKYVQSKKSDYNISVENDCIRLVPNN